MMELSFSFQIAVIIILIMIPLTLIYIWVRDEYFDEDVFENMPYWMYLAFIGIIPLIIGIWVTGELNWMTISVYFGIAVPVVILARFLVVDFKGDSEEN